MIEIDLIKKMKTYDGQGRLQIKTSFPSNRITTIHGPSGSGKTTFLRLIAGLSRPDEGTIKVNNQTWVDVEAGIFESPQIRACGFVFQDYALFPTMTVYEHLKYGATDENYIQRLLSIGQMQAFSKHKPAHLSGGQQQRLAILRALSARPKVLLMDEPFSALDAKLKSSLLPALKALITEAEITCLVVTHYPFETENFSDHFYDFDQHF